MNTSTQLISISIFIIFASQMTLAVSQPDLTCFKCNNTNGNYTSTSRYSKNLKTLLSMMSSNTRIVDGFYNLSVGVGPDRVNGFAVCRADNTPSHCQSLVSEATIRLLIDCPVQKEATGYSFGYCTIRYSNRPILDILDNSPMCTALENELRIPDDSFRQKLKQSLVNFLQQLKDTAAAGSSSYKYSIQNVNVTATYSLYGIARCNPYLSSIECSDCLQEIATSLKQCCSTMSGAGSYGPVCGLEFTNYPVYDPNNTVSAPSSLPAPASGSVHTRIKSGKNRSSVYEKWIAVAGVLSFMLIVTLIVGLSRKNKANTQNKEESNNQIKLVDSLQLDFNTICFATDNFSDTKRLGNGNGTSIFKGVLPDGQEIVVKRLDKGGREGKLEFDNEVLLSTNLQHKNLVKLLGFCIEKDKRILAYEFLPNGNLHDFLDDPIKRASLDWKTRYQIIRGVARGLLYLHQDSQIPAIHRDLKPKNVLFDAQMDPKISNFGSACLIHADQTRGDTRVVGTYGYMPMEYVKQGNSSIKSDVFSYGVILLEIISGHMTCGFSDGEQEKNLLTYAWRKWCDGTQLDMVDEALLNVNSPTNQIQRCIKIGLVCVQEDPGLRPNMSTVLHMLNSDTDDIPPPIRPSPLVINDMDLHLDCDHSNQTHSSHETSINDISDSILDPR